MPPIAATDTSRTGGQRAALRGIPFEASLTTASAVLERETRGTLGVVHERIVRAGIVWVPAFVLTLGIIRMERRAHEELHHMRVWASFDALEGGLLSRALSSPPLTVVGTEHPRLPALISPTPVAAEIHAAAGGLRRARHPAAELTHAAALARLGVLDARQAAAEDRGYAFGGAQVDAVETILLPAYVAISERRGEERAVAVDGLSGHLSQPLSELLSRQLLRLHAAIDARSPR
jgi:hypothetical protein